MNSTRHDNNKTLKFIDLFAGIGGIRKGFELACAEKGFKAECVFTSEIKPHAIKVLQQNHPEEKVSGDITKVDAKEIPDFDFVLAGFPCQAFSAAGRRLGFEDTRGTLFFEVARIIKEKKPKGFVLENVEGLVNHDKESSKDKIGKTLRVILGTLEDLGYKYSWKVLNAKEFGVPQERKRIYIVGTRIDAPSLDCFTPNVVTLDTILEQGLETSDNPFVKMLLSKFSVVELHGKSLKDKRGGVDNIHSWDLEMKGPVSKEQKQLLEQILRERRKKKWAEIYGIDWMDGMPLTKDMIATFNSSDNLQEMLSDLFRKGYLKREFPKRKEGNKRIKDDTLPLGYNIVAGKMSFPVNKILDPNGISPTLVAMDMQGLYVPDGENIRQLSLREGLRLCGYPDDFRFDVTQEEGYDLLGNTVVVPVIRAVAGRVLDIIKNNYEA